MGHSNPKGGQGDGAGFGRLRAAQALRQGFATLIQASHPSANIYIDQVREYAGSQIVFFRASTRNYEHARCAVFEQDKNGHWRKANDIIVAQS